jgi:hypothetical protein
MYKLRQFMKDLTGIVKSEYELTDEEFDSGHSECATDARIVVVGVLVRDGGVSARYALRLVGANKGLTG